MSLSSQPDYPGQLIKVAWPCQDPGSPRTVYGNKASWAEFEPSGKLTIMRPATDEEVRWWLMLQAIQNLTITMGELEAELKVSVDKIVTESNRIDARYTHN